jgi:hypothetical protein
VRKKYVLKADWGLLLPFSLLIPSSPSNFNYVSPPKTINAPPLKTYYVDNIRKVYDEKMANLDKQLSQEVK